MKSQYITKECKYHGCINEDLTYVKSLNNDSFFVYCPMCVQKCLLENLKPLYETKE